MLNSDTQEHIPRIQYFTWCISLCNVEAVQKVFNSTIRHLPPFEGSPRAGAAEYVLRGDVNNQLVTKIFYLLITLF